MTQIKDVYGNLLKVESRPWSDGVRLFSTDQYTNEVPIVLDKKGALNVAADILKTAGHDAVMVEGLPKAETTTFYGTPKIKCNGLTAEISQAELDYFLTNAKESLAIATAIGKELLKQEEKRKADQEAKKVADAKLAVRRDVLARQFSNGFYSYAEVTSATAKAINEVIRLENAK